MSKKTSTTKNCHFISRFLTKPWEGELRNLHYFDFHSGRLGRKTSNKLFAAKKINSQQIESWLSRMVETPLSNIRSRLAAADPKALEDWPFFRAATLMLWLQGMRIQSVTGIDARRSLEQLSKMNPEETDQLVDLVREQYDLHVIFTIFEEHRMAPLMVPSTGFFKFVHADSCCLSGYGIGVGIPLQLGCALVATRQNPNSLIDLQSMSERIANASVGTSQASKVVIDPEVCAAQTEQELAEKLRQLRFINNRLIADVHKLRDGIQLLHSTKGKRLQRDRTGRLSLLQ